MAYIANEVDQRAYSSSKEMDNDNALSSSRGRGWLVNLNPTLFSNIKDKDKYLKSSAFILVLCSKILYEW